MKLSGVKTFSNETSERYARALFELANENSEVEDIEKNIFLLVKHDIDCKDCKQLLLGLKMHHFMGSLLK